MELHVSKKIKNLKLINERISKIIAKLETETFIKKIGSYERKK
ncbi:MAG: hypothetical protein ACOC2W_03425 [bacterium]